MRDEALVADLPGRLDRATFDRVLQRAAELQASSKDIGDGLSEDEVIALGAEVGIPAQHLQQALIEERTRATLPEPSGILDRVAGPASMVVQRVVQGTPETVAAALAKWMERNEHLVVQRASATRITFEPMEAFARGMRRLGAAFDPKRGKPYLGDVDLVTAVITPLEAGFCHVALAASLRKSRASYVTGGFGIALVGAVGGVAMVVSGAVPVIGWLIAVPMGLGGLQVARIFRSRAQRAQLGLERALDELERRPALPGAQPGMPQATIARGVGQVVRDITQEVRKALKE